MAGRAGGGAWASLPQHQPPLGGGWGGEGREGEQQPEAAARRGPGARRDRQHIYMLPTSVRYKNAAAYNIFGTDGAQGCLSVRDTVNGLKRTLAL